MRVVREDGESLGEYQHQPNDQRHELNILTQRNTDELITPTDEQNILWQQNIFVVSIQGWPVTPM